MGSCPGCGAVVDPGAATCPSCGRQQFDAPPPPPSDWLPGDPVVGRGSEVAGPRPRRNRLGCGCGALVGLFVLGVALASVLAVVWAGRSVTDAVTGAVTGRFDADDGREIEGDRLTFQRPVRGRLGEDDTGVHLLSSVEGRVTVTVTGGEGFDPVLRITGPDGTLVAENDDADGLDARLALVLASADELRVEVHEFSGDPGEYTVALLRGDDLVGISPLDAGPLPVGTEVEGEVGRNQAAAHRFTGEGHEVTIDVVGLDGFDPVVRVLDTDGRELARDDDGGAERHDVRLRILVPGAAHVTIEVTGYAGAPGRYRIVAR